MSRAAALFFAAVALAGCAARPRPVDPGPPTQGLAPESRRTQTEPHAAAATVAATPREPAAPAAPAGPPRADEVPARGVEPLRPEEREELARDCARIQSRVGQQQTADRREKRWSVYVDEVLAQAPRKLAGVPDVERCKDLLRREARAQEAKVLEAEAIDALKRIAASLATNLEKTGALCPSAAPIPADVAAVREGYYVPKATDFSAAGWKCVNFSWRAPTRWQLELRVDEAAGSYEVIARGFPVPADAPEELYVRATREAGKLPLTVSVLRRR